MNNSPRMKFITLCVGAALAQMVSLPVLADSGVGVDTVIGNAMNPGYAGGPVQRDSDVPYVKRTPSGQMYGYPPVREEAADGAISGSVEVGYMSADNKGNFSKRKEYIDQQNDGLYLNSFNLSGETAGEHYFSVNGGGLGQDDQFYDLTAGRYGSWRVKAFYNETPHVFSTTYRPLYIDNGTGTPVLNNGAAGLAGVAATVNAYLDALPLTEVALLRKKGGVRADVELLDGWKGYASFARENRDGARPFGLQDANAEGLEPIRYETDDMMAGLQYNDGMTSANLSASASFFRNAIDTLFAPRALTAVNAAPATLAAQDFMAYSLAPDNEAYNLKGELSRKLPDFFDGRVSAAVSFGSSRQNDAIRMPLNPAASAAMVGAAGVALAANAGNVAFDPNNWNGVNGSPLSRATSGQRIDTEMLNLGLNLNPLDDLAMKANYRHYATKNKSGTYYAYNPLTGQWGSGIEQTTGVNYLAAPGCAAAPGFAVSPLCTGPAAINFPANPRSVSAAPRDYTVDNFVVSADYNLGAGGLEAALERENFSHTYRERDKTTEDKLKLGYVNTAIDQLTVRTSFENDRKRGSVYDYLGAGRAESNLVMMGLTPNRAALLNLISTAGAAATATMPSLAQLYAYIVNANFNDPRMQKTDQADRDQNIFNARLNYLAREDLDIGAMVQVKQASYPGNSLAGVQKDSLNTYNIDASYQPSAGMQLTAFYTRQDGKTRTVENYGFVAGQTTALQHHGNICNGGVALVAATVTAAQLNCLLGSNNLRNPAADVTMDTSSTNDILGLGYQQAIGKMTLGIDYTYAQSKSHITHAFGAAALTAAQVGLAGTLTGAYPDMATQQNSLAFNLLIPIDKQMSARLMYSYEDFKVKDWHYDYLQANNALGTLYNDLGPQNYRVNSIGVMVNIEM